VIGNRVALRDGSIVVIRAVQPQDARLLAEGFARLSPESRQLRFLTGKPSLTPAEVHYFTDVDHHNHEALGAVDPGDRLGLGVARFVRHAEDRDGAEVAVTVTDAWQRRGLATELLSRLADRARQEGIHHFTALTADDNEAVDAMLRHGVTGVRVKHREPGTVEYEITLPPRGLGDGLQALLRAFGRSQLKAPDSDQRHL
jgi:GNAT superfamily N-acetyltransferase